MYRTVKKGTPSFGCVPRMALRKGCSTFRSTSASSRTRPTAWCYSTDQRFERSRVSAPSIRIHGGRSGTARTSSGFSTSKRMFSSSRRPVANTTRTGEASRRRIWRSPDLIAWTDYVRWRVALSNPGGYVRSAVVSPCLVVIDEAASGGLVCVDPASGRVLGKRARSRLPEGPSIGLGYLDVAAQGNQVAFLESNPGGSDTLLRFASVPSFEITHTLQLAGDEPTLSLQGDHVFTTAAGTERFALIDARATNVGNALWLENGNCSETACCSATITRARNKRGSS